jgi:hypothetical protein
MKHITEMMTGAVCASLLVACSAPRPDNAPANLVTECQREVDAITRLEPTIEDEASAYPDEPSSARAIEDARAARAVAETGGLASWPDQILMYRCLAANGVVLTPAQSAALSKWDQGMNE